MEKNRHDFCLPPMPYSFPIYVLARDCGEVRRFGSLEELQINLERIDVENHEYLAWDANGLPLKFSICEPMWLLVELDAARTDLTLTEALTKYPDALGLRIASRERDSTTKGKRHA